MSDGGGGGGWDEQEAAIESAKRDPNFYLTRRAGYISSGLRLEL